MGALTLQHRAIQPSAARFGASLRSVTRGAEGARQLDPFNVENQFDTQGTGQQQRRVELDAE